VQRVAARVVKADGRFNPHPARRPGATNASSFCTLI